MRSATRRRLRSDARIGDGEVSRVMLHELEHPCPPTIISKSSLNVCFWHKADIWSGGLSSPDSISCNAQSHFPLTSVIRFGLRTKGLTTKIALEELTTAKRRRRP